MLSTVRWRRACRVPHFSRVLCARSGELSIRAMRASISSSSMNSSRSARAMPSRNNSVIPTEAKRSGGTLRSRTAGAGPPARLVWWPILVASFATRVGPLTSSNSSRSACAMPSRNNSVTPSGAKLQLCHPDRSEAKWRDLAFSNGGAKTSVPFKQEQNGILHQPLGIRTVMTGDLG